MAIKYTYNPEVAKKQAELNSKYGAGLVVDGFLGTKTQSAIQQYGLSNNNLGYDPDNIGGASGRGQDLTQEDFAKLDSTIQSATDLGVPMSEVGNFRSEPTYIIPDGMYKGMTKPQAEAKKAEQGAQVSEMTSYSFNPDSLSTSAKAMEKFNLSLNEITNYPFDSQGTINEKKNSIVNLTANEIAKNFNDAQSFYTTYQNNPELQKTLDPFLKNGGNLSQIASKITPQEVKTDPQSTSDYLASIGKENQDASDPFQLKAINALSAENELVQQEIMRLANIPKEYKDLYFGTKDKIGIIAEQKLLAEEKKKLLEQKELNDKATVQEKAQYQIDKNNADADIAKAEIETNRLNAKNYMTNTLAKLGALQTTGAAPLALATLEQKYQQQKQKLDTTLKFANRNIEIDLTEKINGITEDTDEKILKVQEDLSKTSEEVAKEIFKLQNDSSSKIYNETSKAVQELRKTIDTYRKEAQSNADKYNSNFLMLAGKGIDIKKIPGMIDATGRVDTTKLTNAMFADKEGKFDNMKFDSKATESFFNDLPLDFRQSWQTNYPSWMGTGKATLSSLKSDYQDWLKANPGGKTAEDLNKITLTPTQRTKLIKEKVDVNQYISNPEYRDYVDANLPE